MGNLDAVAFITPGSLGAAIEVTVASIASPTELNSRAAAQGDIILARTVEAGSSNQTWYYADTTSDAQSLPFIVSSATAGVKFLAIAGYACRQTTLQTPLVASSGGTGVNNAGTLTVPDNTSITGGGTLALGGFTLTVPATGTTALLGETQTFTGAKTFSAAVSVTNTTASTSTTTGSLINAGGFGNAGAAWIGTTLNLPQTTGTTLTVSSTDDAAFAIAGGVTIGTRLRINGGQAFAAGDLGVARDATTGAIYFGSGGTSNFIFFNGTHFITSFGSRSSSPTVGSGYSTGAGGTVTQITSRTTGVEINKVCGQITLVSAAGSTSWQSFTVTNSAVATTDTIVVNQDAGTDKYMIHVTAVGAGSFEITYATTGGTTTEQPVFNFSVIKAVAA